MPVARLLPTPEARELLELVRDLADAELLPIAATHEREERFPREVFRILGKAGVLGLPYGEEFGGGGQPYEVWLQVLEELGARWASVAVGVSVHALTCFPLAAYGSATQQSRWLPDMVGGGLLGAYCLSEPDAGSDPGAMRTRAVAVDGGYLVNGVKAWVTHGGHADFYTSMVRTSDARSGGLSCLLVPADAAGLSADRPEEKMGLTGSATATMRFDDVQVGTERLIGAEGQGLPIALAALDAGRLGIAAVATGLAQGALDESVAYAKTRQTFGRAIIDHQGLGFLLADMQAAVQSSRSAYLDAARRKDLGMP